jgi:hypothetical protein
MGQRADVLLTAQEVESFCACEVPKRSSIARQPRCRRASCAAPTSDQRRIDPDLLFSIAVARPEPINVSASAPGQRFGLGSTTLPREATPPHLADQPTSEAAGSMPL